MTRSHSSVRDLAALAAQPRRRKLYSEVRDVVEVDEKDGDEDEEEGDTTMLGYWSNPEAEVNRGS